MKFDTYLKRMPANIPKMVEDMIERLGKIGVNEARKTKRFKHSGSFDQAIQFHSINATSGFVQSGKPYSFYLEEGNNQKGEWIYPVRAKALHFFIGEKEIFAKKVRAHGPLPFMQDAQTKTTNSVQDVASKVFGKYIKVK